MVSHNSILSDVCGGEKEGNKNKHKMIKGKECNTFLYGGIKLKNP